MRITLIASLAAAVAVVAIGFISLTHSPKKEALSIPDLLPRQNEARPSAEFRTSQEQIAKYRAELTEHPDKIGDYVKLAKIYLQESRVTANHHFYVPIAAKLIDETLHRDPNNFEGLVTGAGLNMTLHQFQRAHDMVTRAIKQNPYNATSYGVLCDANLELGNYKDAVVACDSMMSKRPDLRSYARASYLRQLMGEDGAAIQAMLMAANAGATGSENRSWTLYQLGNLFFQSGKLDTAAFIYRGILEERPNYAYAKSGLAMIHLNRGEYSDAVRELVTAMQELPEHVFFEQLADVYLAMGDTASARQMEQRVFTAFEQHEKDGWNIDREFAQFAADHNARLDEAVTRAEREWKRRPTNADAIETYAWTLHKTGDDNTASNLLDRLRATNIVTPTAHYRAAIIYANTGNSMLAQKECNTAQTRLPYTHPSLANETRSVLAQHQLLTAK